MHSLRRLLRLSMPVVLNPKRINAQALSFQRGCAAMTPTRAGDACAPHRAGLARAPPSRRRGRRCPESPASSAWSRRASAGAGRAGTHRGGCPGCRGGAGAQGRGTHDPPIHFPCSRLRPSLAPGSHRSNRTSTRGSGPLTGHEARARPALQAALLTEPSQRPRSWPPAGHPSWEHRLACSPPCSYGNSPTRARRPAFLGPAPGRPRAEGPRPDRPVAATRVHCGSWTHAAPHPTLASSLQGRGAGTMAPAQTTAQTPGLGSLTPDHGLLCGHHPPTHTPLDHRPPPGFGVLCTVRSQSSAM